MSTIKVNKIENTSTTNGGVSIDNDGHVTIDGQQLPTAGPLSNRNLLYNGAATVYQRGENSSISSGTDNFATDRWRLEVDTAGTWTFNQSTDAPSGFGYSHKLDCTTANASLSAGSVLIFQQKLEGQDLQQLDKGTSNAKQLTFSFYVKSAKTGTYIVEFEDANNGRNCQRSYTIDAANTWEYKTLTVPGDTTGSLTNNNGHSFTIRFWLAAGSDFTSGTLQTDWGATVNANRVVGQVNLADSTSNDWFVTGVQLEVGSKATPFEHRSYGDELQRCMRYCQAYTTGRIAAGSFTDVVTGDKGHCIQYLPVAMRTTPTLFSHTKGSLVWEGRAWHAVTATPIITTESSPSIIHWTLGTSSNIINSTENGSIPTMWGNGASAIIQAEL